MELIEKANRVFKKNFKSDTWFERAIFFSWYCNLKDCAFCYMSTLKKNTPIARRTKESILAEAILCKKLGWKIGFLSGGIGAYTQTDFKKLLKLLHKTINEKIWLNVGPLSYQTLRSYLPYTKGVVGSIETINPELHEKVCPSKPIEHYEEMFENAGRLGLKKAMTIIIGLGETIKDFERLKQFIKKHNITKMHFYALNPQKKTIYEDKRSPSRDYHARWVAKTRMEFPKIDIQFGIWLDKVSRVSYLLKAGANSISKFPAILRFNSREAMEIENQAKLARRIFKGTLTQLPNIKISNVGNPAIRYKLMQYLEKMRNN